LNRGTCRAGRALRRRRDDALKATKVTRLRRPGKAQPTRGAGALHASRERFVSTDPTGSGIRASRYRRALSRADRRAVSCVSLQQGTGAFRRPTDNCDNRASRLLRGPANHLQKSLPRDRDLQISYNSPLDSLLTKAVCLKPFRIERVASANERNGRLSKERPRKRKSFDNSGDRAHRTPRESEWPLSSREEREQCSQHKNTIRSLGRMRIRQGTTVLVNRERSPVRSSDRRSLLEFSASKAALWSSNVPASSDAIR
jgi:hypothetical protein